ncbi:MAG: hotdog fold thioesterase [Bacteroidetes bacterium]|uniref:Hotdog fold thioesterase n=1 Tax=Phaeocystidibacter marisrubri TaxID=1577780 RepID=A0A6L3ZHU0_9FLAO|nr:hotdog fold thioesterase [Phaeocystidibacter marisrubri]KAB2817407.1 hotdog fold thioesterase [Phaeocystidibacter marisrubri]TNE29345.1 MAG: hotdog fold thioesterase [Bacteroidota bacterium]GGH75498.1 thioesterase [Phaeocystidibacter marisrubri]
MTKEEKLAHFNAISTNTLMETLEIKYIDFGEDWVKASMPVNSRVHQPVGLLHGGATVALCESLGSGASMMFVDDPDKYVAVGIEISANHVRSITKGMVYCTGKIIHKGRSTHLWEMKVEDENGKLISFCKMTNMIVPRASKQK